MGTNPMLMGMYGMSDDFYTQMMYQQMMNGGYANNAGWGAAAGTQKGGGQTQQAAQGGSSLGRAAVYGTAAAGAAGAATLFTGYGLNSPVEEGKHGGVKFTDDFMKRFSGEYHAIKNDASLKNFFKTLSAETPGVAKFTVTAENYDKLMDELRSFFDDPSNPKVADMSDDLKGFLKHSLGKADAYDLVDTDVDSIRNKYAELLKQTTDFEFKDNYNLQKSLYEQFDDLGKEFLNCADDAAKVEFLKNNPQFAKAFNLDATDWTKILKGETDVLAKIQDTTGSTPKIRDGVKATLKTDFENLEKTMQSFAKKWDGKVGFLGKGKFNLFKGNKVGGALDGALSSLRTSKAWKHAGLAGLAVAGATLLFNA